jgi:hypothetical protein
MNPRRMSDDELLRLILTVSLIVVVVSVVGYIVFSWFMRKERSRGEAFRDRHSAPPRDPRDLQ